VTQGSVQLDWLLHGDMPQVYRKIGQYGRRCVCCMQRENMAYKFLKNWKKWIRDNRYWMYHKRWFSWMEVREDRTSCVCKLLKPNSTCIGLQTGRVLPINHYTCWKFSTRGLVAWTEWIVSRSSVHSVYTAACLSSCTTGTEVCTRRAGTAGVHVLLVVPLIGRLSPGDNSTYDGG